MIRQRLPNRVHLRDPQFHMGVAEGLDGGPPDRNRGDQGLDRMERLAWCFAVESGDALVRLGGSTQILSGRQDAAEEADGLTALMKPASTTISRSMVRFIASPLCERTIGSS